MLGPSVIWGKEALTLITIHFGMLVNSNFSHLVLINIVFKEGLKKLIFVHVI